MVQSTPPNNTIIVHFECFDNLPHDNYVAWIEGEAYKGIVVSGDSVGDCMKEVGISLNVLEMYRRNIKK